LSEIMTAPRFHSGISSWILSTNSLFSSYSFMILAYSFLFSIFFFLHTIQSIKSSFIK
jgi:hypothetical protein